MYEIDRLTIVAENDGMLMEGVPVLLHFSFPRAGGHYLTHSIRALYDTYPEGTIDQGGIIWPTESTSASRGVILPSEEENKERDNEINPLSRYALMLRDSTARCPLNLVHGRTGMHGLPGNVRQGEYAVIILRDPLAIAYSHYRVFRDRWSPGEPYDSDSVRQQFERYLEFCDATYALKEAMCDTVMIVRYESLVASAAELRDFCNFLGFRPKLEPEYVWHITKFENFTRQQARTFYREGRNDAWREDGTFREMLRYAGDFDFTPYGYRATNAYLEAEMTNSA